MTERHTLEHELARHHIALAYVHINTCIQLIDPDDSFPIRERLKQLSGDLGDRQYEFDLWIDGHEEDL